MNFEQTTALSPIELRREVAEALGSPQKALFLIPKYESSLDAMHAAEEALTDREWPSFEHDLCRIVGWTPQNREGKRVLHATAAQRAQAFILTKSAS